MTEPTPPPRRPLATFLRATPGPAAASEPSAKDAPEPAAPAEEALQAHMPATDAEAAEEAIPAAEPPSEPRVAQPEPVSAPASAQEESAVVAPSFTRAPAAAPRAPRWQWGLVGGLVALLVVQIMVADRANLAADAGSRPWVAGLCSVLRCELPAWHEPTAFSMISRDVRPVPTQPGALQVQASFRNDARWGQAWPQLRLSLSDADGRVIGTGVFAPQDYLGPDGDATSILEPGQSAQIAFRVREPAASTVAFTFEFL
ncbi:DUF3426 domain-containing protein [Stenotrophomonas sp.]|uniref:DUF3426 domain-containing protein n=1 Tax=Stenotrophomonas sp. TaxID=69392 RepID=UPI00289ACCC9|nr:DUF3426 domain-containing protein [Stenotrophomonas sp.]